MLSYEKKIESAISLIRSIPNDGPIELAYSGGKDSDVILELSRMAGVDVVPIYKQTSIDPPGTTAHVKRKGAEIRRPKVTMFELIENHGLPNRTTRFCCAALKEYPIYGRVILGIRRSESMSRQKRYNEPESCRLYSGGFHVRQYFPILYWEDEDVERFVLERDIECHPLYYDENGVFRVERRLGCLGCPMSQRGARTDFLKYPKMLALWLRALRKWRDSHPNAVAIERFRDEYDQMYCNLFSHSMKDYEDNINMPIYPVGCDDKSAWRERYFGVSPLVSVRFPDDRFKLNTKLFLEDYFGINFEAK